MAPVSTKTTVSEEIVVAKVETGILRIFVVGDSPLVLNRLAEKARQELLLPGRRKTAQDKERNLKHDVIYEFRSSANQLLEGDTLLGIDSTAFKGSLMSAALDLPNVRRTQIGRLSFVPGEYVSVYGIPKLYMATVRTADMNRTPDIRTRCIVPRWAASFDVVYVRPLLTATAIANLLVAAGIYIGVGDGRPEKGKLNFGRFHLVTADDAEYQAIVAEGSRAVQTQAMAEAIPYDKPTEELLSWFVTECGQRQFDAEKKITKAAKAGSQE